MNKIEKLLRKISEIDRKKLLELLEILLGGGKKMRFIKIKNTDFYRLRYAKFRIIFHKESGNIVVDSIKIRNENIYKNIN